MITGKFEKSTSFGGVVFHGSKSGLRLPKNFKTFVNTLANKVAEIGKRRKRKNYYVDSCRYSQVGSCGRCIIGQAIVELYPDLYQALRKYEKTQDGGSVGIDAVVESLYETQSQYSYSYPALQYLIDAQSMQDHGEKWGNVVETLENTYGI